MNAANWRQRAGAPERNLRTSRQRSDRDWQLGQIAYLKNVSLFSAVDDSELIKSGHLPKSATNHPVIILDKSPDGKQYIVTTVSAYSSSAANNYLPPWQRPHLKDMVRSGFRAFPGCAKPDNNQNFLQLTTGQSWPKPETSWVYIHRVYIVPTSVLAFFNKAGGVQLCMAKDSFDELVHDLKIKNPEFRHFQQQIQPKRSITPQARAESAHKTRDSSQPWRQADNAQDRTRSASPKAKLEQKPAEVKTSDKVLTSKSYSSTLQGAAPNPTPVHTTCAAEINIPPPNPRKWSAVLRA
ncbi:hypothetical protein F5Y18DRAFT_441633 [Xylariaceae sp. FL1019]|nr:hypothetical protein F5Y18DRAFT_441633 [Xylariaceae sp. FL1019]